MKNDDEEKRFEKFRDVNELFLHTLSEFSIADVVVMFWCVCFGKSFVL